ncbi:hypothetical protein OAT15_03995 [Gammaproteobacteria bacterium]|nr:hypothetical protein [Gammaproteobacteria bacterium]
MDYESDEAIQEMMLEERYRNSYYDVRRKEKAKMVVGFIAAVICGVLLTVTFFQGYQEIASILFPGILAIAIFVPVFREEYLLGFILAMSFGFGAVLPIIFTTLIATASAIIYFTGRFIWKKLFVKTTKQS